MKDIKTIILQTIAVDAANRGIPLSGVLKETYEKMTPDEIANEEIKVLNAEYELEEINNQ